MTSLYSAPLRIQGVLFFLSFPVPPHCLRHIITNIPLSGLNCQRVDPAQAIETTEIYRDLWERLFRPLHETDRRLREVEDTFN